MSSVGRTVLRVLAPSVLSLTLSTAATASGALASELARCAAVTASPARLACYDALAGRSATDSVPTSDRATAAVAPATAPPATPRPPPAPEPADAVQTFGLSASERHAAPQGTQAIQARIARLDADQLRRSYVVLDNGQTWASTEGEMILDSGELVTIQRAALGSFILTSAHSKHSYHVRRIR